MARIARGRELEPTLALLDEPGLLEHLRELAEAVERPGGVVAEQLAGAVEVDLGELARLGGRLQQVLEVVEVAERVEQARHLAELQRIVAAEVLLRAPTAGWGTPAAGCGTAGRPASAGPCPRAATRRAPWSCARCSGVIEFISCCICAIDCAICSSSSSRVCGLPGKNSP